MRRDLERSKALACPEDVLRIQLWLNNVGILGTEFDEPEGALQILMELVECAMPPQGDSRNDAQALWDCLTENIARIRIYNPHLKIR